MNNVADEICHRVSELKSQRVNFDDYFQQVRDLVWPETGDFTYRRSPGEKSTERIYEMTAALALEKGAAALEAFMTPRQTQWHRLIASTDELNDIPAVKEWFESATDLLFRWRNAPKSRFYGQIHEVWKSEMAFGNACMSVFERDEGGTRYQQIHIGQAWFEQDFEGIPDTIYREYELTARAAMGRWGKKAPKCASNCVKETPFKKHTYISVVRPNDKWEPGVKTSKPFETLEVSKEDKMVIEQGGYYELPYIWSRYTVNPHEQYGRGPGMFILPDIQTLQEMQKTFMRAGHKVADPPLLVADDGVLGRGEKQVRLTPGGMTVGGLGPNGEIKVAPLQTGAKIDMTEAMMETLRDNVREAFLVDLFDVLIRDRVTMTATEVLERAKEKGQLITPVVGRQQSELLGPLIDREIKIAMRQGALPQLPDELLEAKGEYEIEYESGATRMQKADEVLGVQRALEIMMPFLEADPTLLQIYEIPELAAHVNSTLGVPTKFLKPLDEYEELKGEINAAQAAEMEQAKIPAAASAAKDLAAAGAMN